VFLEDAGGDEPAALGAERVSGFGKTALEGLNGCTGIGSFGL